jgi:hypothetical protein
MPHPIGAQKRADFPIYEALVFPHKSPKPQILLSPNAKNGWWDRLLKWKQALPECVS